MNRVSPNLPLNTGSTVAGVAGNCILNANVGNYSYTWDANKLKTGETITGPMSGYGFSVGTSGYDDQNRLIAWNRTDGNKNQSWNLTPVGDWSTFTENATAQTRTHGPAHDNNEIKLCANSLTEKNTTN